MTTPREIKLVTHPAFPAWGRCLVAAERDGKLFLLGEDGEEHVLAQSFGSKLTAITLAAAEAGEVAVAIQNRRAVALGKRVPRGKPRKVAPKAPRLTFEQQVERFNSLFPGGFQGEAFAVERGNATTAASREGAIELAKTALSKDALTDEAGYDRAAAVLTDSKLIQPMEGSIAIKSMPAEHRMGFAAALRNLLHGSGDFEGRFDALVSAVKLVKPDGEAKRPSWPFVTLFGGVHAPKEHVFVKPKLLLEQAAILGVQVDYDPLPSGKAYGQIQELLRTVEGKLRAAGLQPRDLMDVSTFVLTTLAAPADAAADKTA